jgi:hypothetical protein
LKLRTFTDCRRHCHEASWSGCGETLTQRVNDMISEHGKWLWTTLLLPVFGWMAKKRSASRKAAAGPSA